MPLKSFIFAACLLSADGETEDTMKHMIFYMIPTGWRELWSTSALPGAWWNTGSNMYVKM